MSNAEQHQEALDRAENGESTMNYGAIFEGFMAKGIPEEEIEPRINVFGYGAWQAKGRQVRKGEHGVKVQTWIPVKERHNPATGETEQAYRRPKLATVFHISQTKEADE